MHVEFRLQVGSENFLDLDDYPQCNGYYELAKSMDMDHCPQVGWQFILFPSDPDTSSTAIVAGVRMNHGTDPTLFDLVAEDNLFDDIKEELLREGWVQLP